MVTLLEKIDQTYYEDFIYIYRQKIFIYAESRKAIYGTIEASLLSLAKISKILEEMLQQRKEIIDVL